MSGSPRTASGFTLMELLASIVILAAAVLTVAQTVAVVTRQRQLTERRALALQEAENTMEHVYALPWGELTQEGVAKIQLSDSSRHRLPQAAVQVSVQASGNPPTEKRVLVEVDWQDAGSGRSRPVRLLSWRFQPRERQP